MFRHSLSLTLLFITASFCGQFTLPGWAGVSVPIPVDSSKIHSPTPVETGISYLPANSPTDKYAQDTCKLDLYLPSNAQAGFPLLVWFHGGGLQSGSRKGDAAVARRFAEKGVAFAAAGYRLSPKVKYPAYIEDAARAVAWAVTEGVKRGANPGAIFVGGHSAGGYLAAMLATDKKYLQSAGVAPVSIAGYLPISGQLITHSAVRQERGLTRSTILADEASPLYHVRQDTQPVLLLVGDRDMAGRLEETRLFTTAMTEIAKNRSTSMQIVANRSHVTIYTQLLTPGDTAGPAMLAFIEKWTKSEKTALNLTNS